MSRADNYGVEVEVEGIRYDFDDRNHIENHRFIGIDVPPDLKLNHWSAVKDGSLRRGTEFIFKGPKSYDNSLKALSQLQALFDTAASQDSGVILSERCSVHVHLDCRELTKNEVINLILTYLLVERVMFSCIDIFRQKNTYCRPLSDSAFLTILMDMLTLSGIEKNSMFNFISRHCDKYSALNLLPLISYGSIEFRHHQGTADTTEIVSWINLIRALKDASLISDISSLLNIYDTLGYRSLLSHIFPDREDLLEIAGIDALVYSGVVTVKEVLLNNKLKEINSVIRKDNKSELFKEFLRVKGRV